MYCGLVCSHLNMMELKLMHVPCKGYGAAIDACAKAGRWEEARGLLDERWLKLCICKLHIVGMGQTYKAPKMEVYQKLEEGVPHMRKFLGPVGPPNADPSLNLSGVGWRWKVVLCTRPQPSPWDPQQTQPCR